jgi:hypothetical protein
MPQAQGMGTGMVLGMVLGISVGMPWHVNAQKLDGSGKAYALPCLRVLLLASVCFGVSFSYLGMARELKVWSKG